MKSEKEDPLSAREIAFKALGGWESQKIEVSRTLECQFSPQISDREKAFAQELALGILRRKLTLDEIIRQYSKRDLEKISLETKNILRLGLYQILYLDRVPVYSAVDESVKLAKKFCKGQTPQFVNAILREFLRRDKLIQYPGDPIHALSLSASYPLELVQRWVKLWGVQKARALCEAGNLRIPWTLRVNSLKTTPSSLLVKLKEEGLKVVQSPDHPLAIRLTEASPLAKLKSFEEGHFQVQDESMLKVIDQMDLEPDLKILDLCSAPGTKATAIAERIKDQGFILSVDRSFSRLCKIIENMRRLDLHSIHPVVGDARFIVSVSRTLFDRILLDVPCSNTGVLAKRPEARWRFSVGNLRKLSIFQTKLLKASLAVLKSGGILVYSTCSIDPIENEEVIQSVLSGKSQFSLLQEQTYFPSENSGGGYWAKIKRVGS